jgi:hypothetical protein
MKYFLYNFLILCWIIIPFSVQGVIIYVSKSGSPSASGLNWADAFDDFTHAISIASDGDTLFVAQGEYLLPFQQRLWITQNLHIFGGFSGWESSVDERVLGDSLTILFGNDLYSKIEIRDIKEHIFFDGICFADGYSYYPQHGVPIDDSLFYIRFGGIVSVVLSGYVDTVDIGFINCSFVNSLSYSGGALHIAIGLHSGSLRIKNCLFKDNTGWWDGSNGAFVINVNNSENLIIEIDSCTFINNGSGLGYSIFSIDYWSDSARDSIIVSNCLFEGNVGGNDSYGHLGFTRWNDAGGRPFFIVERCLFVNNILYSKTLGFEFGGFINSVNISYPFFVKWCSFVGNYTNGYGLLSGWSFNVENSLFSNNYSRDGGSVYFDQSTFVWPLLHVTKFTNCTFVNNRTKGPGVLFLKRGPFSHFELENCVLSNNTSTYHPAMLYSTTADTSNVVQPVIRFVGGDVLPDSFHYNEQSDTWTWNADSVSWLFGDPLFVDTASGDFRLKRCSPMINKGNNALVTWDTDLAGAIRIQEDTIDLGAYERIRFMPQIDILAATCAHDPDGEILLFPGGFEPPVQWIIADTAGGLWENGYLGPGNYTSLLQDGEDCVAGFEVHIEGPDSIQVRYVAQGTMVGLSSGAIVIDSIFGGIPDYSIQWFDGENGLSRTNLFPGWYSITVSDEVDCAGVWDIEVPLISHAEDQMAVGTLYLGNPVVNRLFYHWEPGTTGHSLNYYLVNGYGQRVADGMVSAGLHSVDLTGLTSGYYWFVIYNHSQRAVYPIALIQH